MESTKEKIDPQKVNGELNTPTVTVIGWLLVLLIGPIIMVCGYNNSQINVVFWVGVAMFIAGVICITVGKQKQKQLR